MQKLDCLADQQCAEPPATRRASAQGHVERHTHQAGTDARTRQVLDEAPGHRLEDVGAAGAPQHHGIT